MTSNNSEMQGTIKFIQPLVQLNKPNGAGWVVNSDVFMGDDLISGPQRKKSREEFRELLLLDKTRRRRMDGVENCCCVSAR